MALTECPSRDRGVALAIAAAGGQRRLARATGIPQPTIAGWRQVPQARLFVVAAACGVEAEQLRPDLAEYIALERRRRVLARGRERFAIAAAAAAGAAELPGEDELIDYLVGFSAVRFVARARGLEIGQVIHGAARPEQEARAWAMGLAMAIGRASSHVVAGIFGCTRQNVENASFRYIRARDGDDPEDWVEGEDEGTAKVIERGRLRAAKHGPDRELIEHEAKFEAILEGKRR